jgi:DNA-binding MarR family transcriptional regulator
LRDFSRVDRQGIGGVIAAGPAAALAVPAPHAVSVVLAGLLGAGLGIDTPASNAEIMAAVPARDGAAAGGMVNMTRSTGTALAGARDEAGGPQPEDGLAEGIARLRRALRRGARAADPANTLAVAQLELLAALTEHPRSRPGQLARRLNMRANTVTTIVNGLSDREMLSRVASADDRRAVELTVTEAGRQAVQSWQAVNAGVLHEALAMLPARQRRALAAAVPALDARARAVDRLADTPGAAD